MIAGLNSLLNGLYHRKTLAKVPELIGASIKKRAVCFIVDMLIITAINVILFFVMIYAEQGEATPFARQIYDQRELIYYIFLFSTFLYYTVQIYFFQKTPGYAIFDLKIIRCGGGAISYRDCFIRFAGALISLMTLFIYDAVIFCRGKRLLLQDVFSNTYPVEGNGTRN